MIVLSVFFSPFARVHVPECNHWNFRHLRVALYIGLYKLFLFIQVSLQQQQLAVDLL